MDFSRQERKGKITHVDLWIPRIDRLNAFPPHLFLAHIDLWVVQQIRFIPFGSVRRQDPRLERFSEVSLEMRFSGGQHSLSLNTSSFVPSLPCAHALRDAADPSAIAFSYGKSA